ncbi:SAM dependent carboxyl methyltransferase [Corchorus olitorius]|uniref:SAM dependent carboxyl methyltransferase n=1 Tax=Corchorus olitorius TaxID=93759 RepID=A0A1R3HY04_9ROSI|nr:SAM dependent carboxyl methyltransferase [Corchorus olitorius]
MEVFEVLHMNKGNGETSYAKNSTVQSKIISVGKPIMEEAVLELSCNSNVIESMGIADLGCSSGPNTLSVISEIMDMVPPGLESNAMTPLNKGKIYISKSSPQSVLDAYALQFQKNFSVFIKSRSQELVPGGRMVLSFMGRKSFDPTSDESCYQWELLAQAIMSMVEEGLIEEEKLDSFNAPYYAPSAEEIKVEIQKEGSFVIDRLEAFEIDWDGGAVSDVHTAQGKLMIGQRVAKTIRAVVESMLESHFAIGPDLMDDLFCRYADIVGNHLSKTRTKYIDFVISLIKKG